MRMVPLSGEQLQSLEDTIRQTLIPAITGRHTITEEEGDLFSLPVRDGGMGIPIPLSSQQRSLSQRICSPLVEAVLRQQKVFDPNLMQEHAKNKQEVIHQHVVEKNSIATNTVKCLPPKLQRQISIISPNSSSSWLSAIPLKAYYFVLHKRVFLDAVALRYIWLLSKWLTNQV